MKILHVIPSLAPCHGGPSVMLPIMEKALTAEGFIVETVTTDDDGPGKRNHKGDGKPRSENGVIRRYFPKQTEFYKISLPLVRWMKVNVSSFDIVHIHALFSHTSVVAARIAAKANVPYIIRPLGVLTRYGLTQRRRFLKKLSLHWIEGPVLRAASAIHFTMEAEMLEANELGIEFRSVVIPLGLEARKKVVDDSELGNIVLYMSRLNPKKNIEALLHAWSKGHAERPAWKLVIAGSGDDAYVKSLREQTKRLGIESSVVWLGHVQGDQKEMLLNQAAIFTLPSFSENFGIAAAEAMLAGKACLFTAGVAVGEFAARHGAAMIAQTDPESLAKALAELIDDKNVRAKLSTEALNFGKRELSADVMGGRMKVLYQRITKGEVL